MTDKDIISIELEDEDTGEDDAGDETAADDTDYKVLYEQTLEAKEQAEAEKQKWKERFKGAKASENKNT